MVVGIGSICKLRKNSSLGIDYRLLFACHLYTGTNVNLTDSARLLVLVFRVNAWEALSTRNPIFIQVA